MIIGTHETYMVGKLYPNFSVTDSFSNYHIIPAMILREATFEEWISYTMQYNPRELIHNSEFYKSAKYYEISID